MKPALLLATSAALSLAPSLAAQCELETQEFSADDGEVGDVFGYRLGLQGDVAAVAATFDDDLGLDSGSAYVHERDPHAGWVFRKKLLASNGGAGDSFAYSIAVDGTTVVVGAPQHAGRGALYVFARDQGGPGNWGEVATFTPPNASAGALFGFSLAIRGNRMVVGAPYTGLDRAGSVYLYRRDAASVSGWTLERELTAASATTGFSFGHALALDGDTLAISGAEVARSPYPSTFVVHVLERDLGGPDHWGERQRLAAGLDPTDLFGYRLGLSDGWLAVAAPGEVAPDFMDVGALYLFERDRGGAGNWGEARRLEGPGGGAFTPEQLLFSGDWLVAGSPSFAGAGAAFVFARNEGGENAFGLVTTIQDLPLEQESAFGQGLALDGDELHVGASGMYASGPSGENYTYDLGRLARASWRSDAARRNPDSLTVSTPELGTTFGAVVDLASSGHALAALMVFQQRAEIAFPTGQVLLGRERLGLQLASGPRASFALALPSAPALCGLEVTLQAAHLAPGRSFQLSNAQDLVLGMR